jgi:hypothetical protein
MWNDIVATAVGIVLTITVDLPRFGGEVGIFVSRYLI